MHTNEFENAFSDFLNESEYDQAQSALFSLFRLAFSAGWQAAGGQKPKNERFLSVHKANQNIQEK